jgi:NADH-quinone oxidoreductase subunit N
MNTLITLTGIGALAMLSEIFRFRKALYPLVIIGLALAAGLAFMDWGTEERYFSDMMFFDNYAIAFSGLMIGTTLLWFILGGSFIRGGTHETDYTSLITFSLAGAVVMVSFADLTMLFIGLEILSIAMYVMAASGKSELRSNEAGFKYFLMGAFATGFLLFGVALVYGVTGTFNLVEIAGYVSANASAAPVLLKSGIILVMIGLVFKISAAPFHFWAPDVYEGAPTPVTAYMSTVVKTAAFAAFLRLFQDCFIPLTDWWTPVLAVCSALTMLLGNILAVYQSSLKRMLAYSSIAHAGYMLLSLVAMNDLSDSSLLLYAAAYSAGSIGLFTLVMSMTENRNESVASLTGFATVNKSQAALISLLLLSMAGIPPVAGFFAKYYIFTAALKSGYTWLVLIAVLSSLVGVYYYLRVLVAMYQPAGRDSVQFALSPAANLVLWISVLVTVFLGVMPMLITGLI